MNKIIYRDGTPCNSNDQQDRLIQALYQTLPGRIFLKLLTQPALSHFAGCMLNTKASRCLIKPFIRNNQIDMSQYEKVHYKSYNEFFSRKIRPECRPVDPDPAHMIAPCDSKLTIVPIDTKSRFTLKHTPYTLASLLQNKALADQYMGGYALIFRLAVEDYHRYCYVCDGKKGKNIRIPGVLHTVNPIANDHFPIYKENSRQYSILRSKTWGDILMMEVGALLVGKIVNYHERALVHRGQEKGYFQFGGSTVVLLFQPNTLIPDADLLENSRLGLETVVHFGEKIGTSRLL